MYATDIMKVVHISENASGIMVGICSLLKYLQDSGLLLN
jgi:hypothetical protein